MEFEIVEGIQHINLDMTMTTALAAVLLIIGYAIKNKVNWLQKYCIPAPVIGGFLFMLITFLGFRTNSFVFNFDTVLQPFLMLMFFTTVGLGASFQLVKKVGYCLLFIGQ